jgi:excisionase family DNA binding protein
MCCMDDMRFLRLSDVAARLSISRATARRLVDAGTIPAVSLAVAGKRRLLRVPAAEFERTLQRTSRPSHQGGGSETDDAA